MYMAAGGVRKQRLGGALSPVKERLCTIGRHIRRNVSWTQACCWSVL